MKKKLMMALSLVLVAALSITGTIAFLTSTTETVTNTFSVGKVEITLDEAPVDVYGDEITGDRRIENTYKLIPGHDYKKDPTIHVKGGSEQCWLFVKVVNGISGIEAADSASTKSIATQMQENGWTLVTGETNVYWHEVVDARNTAESEFIDVPVFGSFTIDGSKDVSAFGDATITIEGYAIQADTFDDAAAAWAAAPATWTTDAGEETP